MAHATKIAEPSVAMLKGRIAELEYEVDQLRRAHAAISDIARRYAGPELCPVEVVR